MLNWRNSTETEQTSGSQRKEKETMPIDFGHNSQEYLFTYYLRIIRWNRLRPTIWMYNQLKWDGYSL